MFNENHLLNKVWMFVALPMLLFPSMALPAEISQAELLNLLREKDQIANTTDYIVSFSVVKNASLFDPNQGQVFMNCQATWAKEAFAMKISYHYKHPTVYSPIGTCNYRAMDYDQDGNLIVWRRQEKCILWSPIRNQTIERIESFFVDPSDKLLDKGGTQTIAQHFPVGSRKNTYELNQFELAMGRGFSRHFGTVKSVESLSSGLNKVTSQGSHGGIQGSWELTLEPNSDYLAREAVFTPDGKDKHTIKVTSSGIISKNGMKLAKYGTFKFLNILKLSVEVTDISKVIGTNELYEEVRLRLKSPLPSGSEIIDLRGEKSVTTTVK